MAIHKVCEHIQLVDQDYHTAPVGQVAKRLCYRDPTIYPVIQVCKCRHVTGYPIRLDGKQDHTLPGKPCPEPGEDGRFAFSRPSKQRRHRRFLLRQQCMKLFQFGPVDPLPLGLLWPVEQRPRHGVEGSFDRLSIELGR